MKKRSRLIAEVLNNYWAVDPEFHAFMLDFLYGKIEPNLFLAKELRDAEESDKKEKMETINMIGGTNIAYIPIMGTIYPRSTGMGEICGTTETTVTGIRKSLNAALDDDDVKGILFDHDSPGGAVTGIHGLYQDIIAARSVKPIHAFSQGTVASADFWLFSAASNRSIDATARIGSVGVVVGAKKKDKADSYVEVTNSMSPYKRLDIEDEKHYKTLVKTLDDIADVFYSSLADAYALEKDYVINNFGKGGIRVGADALENKMVDSIGSFSSAVSMLQEDITSGKKVIVDMAAKNSVDNFVATHVITKPSEDITGGTMNLTELKANHPELVAAIVGEASATSSAKIVELTASIAEKDSKISALTAENESLAKTVSDMEKDKIKATIAGSVVVANSVFDGVFAASSIPEKFKTKVHKQVSAESFMGSDGNLDVAAYKSAVETEVAEWEASFSGTTTAGVSGSDTRTTEDITSDADDSDDSDAEAYADKLLKMC